MQIILPTSGINKSTFAQPINSIFNSWLMRSMGSHDPRIVSRQRRMSVGKRLRRIKLNPYQANNMSEENYIPENIAFPGSAVAVDTAVPVFIGYTAKAESKGKSLIRKARRIISFAEYVELFGGGFKTQFTIEASGDVEKGAKLQVKPVSMNRPRLYDSIRLFYANGGGTCFILSLGVYGNLVSFSIDPKDFENSGKFPDSPLQLLEKEREITLINIPDAAALQKEEAYALYQKVLAHCAKMQNRFAIFDLVQPEPGENTPDLFRNFREGIGTDNLKYGAAYYPWLNTSIVQPDEVDFENIDPAVDLAKILPENGIRAIIAGYRSRKLSLESSIRELQADLAVLPGANPERSAETAEKDKQLQALELEIKNLKSKFHQALKSSSPVYVNLLNEIRALLNALPAGGAVAGIYTFVDFTRGVWKAPANVTVNCVSSPVIAISAEEHASLQANETTGKSINLIRDMPGTGTLIWGGRTLDGNSQDWRYINVCRTLMMIEESIKLAVRSYVFEPNDAGTWITVRSMIENFLVNLWKQGALAGATPDQAFDVQIGLGSTMTPTDILDGRMLVTIKVAVSKPAEFIVITFQQQQQQS